MLEINNIYNVDAISGLKQLDNNSIHCIIYSPPYWALRSYLKESDPNKVLELGQELFFKDYLNTLIDINREVKRVLRPDGTLFVNIGDTFYGGTRGYGGSPKQKSNKGACAIDGKQFDNKELSKKCLCNIPARFAIRMTDELGFILRNEIIWHIPNKMPHPSQGRFVVDFEKVFFFVKSQKYYFNQLIEPFSKQSNPNEIYTGQATKDYEGQKAQNPSDAKRRILESMQKRGGRIKRSVWSINNKPSRTNHTACVTPDTQILTLNGWKYYYEIEKYKTYNIPKYTLVATYNIDKKIIEYQRLSNIKEYNYEGNLIHLKHIELDILMTPNHRNVVIDKKGIEKIVLAEDLNIYDKIKVFAPIVYPENNGIGLYFAELIGWILAEGHLKSAKYKYLEIYQNLNEHAERIDFLLDKLQIPYSRDIRKREYKGNQQVVWYLKRSPLVEWIFNNIPNKELNQFLISLPLKEIQAIFNALIGGDGHIRKDDGRRSFIQKSITNKDWFQILALRLGYAAYIDKDKTVYLNNKTEIGIRSSEHKIHKYNIPYSGKVWCPKTPNGTWVARRNGRIFITGNTFPPALVENMILSGCPDNGVVLDIFAGIGTTCYAAKKLNRQYLGFDLNSEFVEIAQNKLNNS